MKRSDRSAYFLPAANLALAAMLLATNAACAEDELTVSYENQIIIANSPAPDEIFGYNIAVDGATAAIAKRSGETEPAVLLYRYTANGWQYFRTIPQPEGTLNTRAPEVELEGDTLLFGVPSHDGTDACTVDGRCGNSGLVYVFERHAGGPDNWGLVATLDGGVKPGASFGSGMAVEGSTVAIAAIGEDAARERSGAIYLFERQSGTAGQWILEQRIEYAGAYQDALFGAPLILDGDTLVTGIQPTPAGTRVLVYERQAGEHGSWNLAEELVFPQRRLYGIAFEGDTLLWVDLDERDGSWAGMATYEFYGRNANGTWVPEQSWQERMAWQHFPDIVIRNGRMLERAQDGVNLLRVYARDRISGQWAPVAHLGVAGLSLPDRQSDFAVSGELALVGIRSESNGNQGEVLAYDLGLPVNFGHAGAWYDPDTSGQGILVDADSAGQYIFLSWFTYTDASAAVPGEPHWFTAQGPYDGSTAALTLHESLGGAFGAAGGVDTEPVGEFVIGFPDCDRGTARYRIDTLGLHGEIPLQRLLAGSADACEQLSGSNTEAMPMTTGMDGAWYDDAMPGQGFLVDANSNGTPGYAFVSWFTYGAGTASGQRWLTAQGGFEGPTATLNLHETTGGLFDDPKQTQTVPVGTLSLDFTDCNHARMDYELPGEALTGSMEVIRLLPGAAEFCESVQ